MLLAATLRLQAGGVIYVVLHDQDDITLPFGKLAQGPDGSLYVACESGDSRHYYGGIAKLIPTLEAIYTYQTFFTFPSGSGGGFPSGGLAIDGNTLYGATYGDGANNTGVLFSINTAGTGYTPFSFDATPLGTNPKGVTFVGGNLFVTEETAGPSQDGSIGDFNGDGILQSVHVFSGNDGKYPLGPVTPQILIPTGQRKAELAPHGTLASIDPATITLYGVTLIGGTNGGVGTIYKVNGDGGNFKSLHSFAINNNSANDPVGGMVLSGNTLYGTASAGGTNGSGVIFQINTDGSGYAVLKTFSSATFVSASTSYTNGDGYGPRGDLALAGDTLYGTANGGGPNGGGTVFSINTNGSNFTMLHSFLTPIANPSGAYTNIGGGFPTAGVLVSGNKLFGATSQGGTNGGGVIFELILPAPPALNLAPSGGNLAISWPSSATNFVLQQNATLSTATWSNFTGGFLDDGTNRSVHLPPPAQNIFFRLLSTNGL